MTRDPSRARTCWTVEGRPCPRCGHTLVTNGDLEWCGYRAGREWPPCDYRAYVPAAGRGAAAAGGEGGEP